MILPTLCRRCGGLRNLNTARENIQFIRMVTDNRLISVPRLRVEMIRRFRRRLSVRSIVNRLLVVSYRSRCPARCPRLTLGHMRCCRMWGRMHRWDLRHWRHCVFGDDSRFTLFHSDGRARVRRRLRERLIDSRIWPTDGNMVSHGMGCHRPWWEEWTGGAGWNPQPPMLHQASLQ